MYTYTSMYLAYTLCGFLTFHIILYQFQLIFLFNRILNLKRHCFIEEWAAFDYYFSSLDNPLENGNCMHTFIHNIYIVLHRGIKFVHYGINPILMVHSYTDTYIESPKPIHYTPAGNKFFEMVLWWLPTWTNHVSDWIEKWKWKIKENLLQVSSLCLVFGDQHPCFVVQVSFRYGDRRYQYSVVNTFGFQMVSKHK